MITKQQYETLKKEFGKVASFAVWKNDIDDLDFFSRFDDFDKEQQNAKLPDDSPIYVFVALNPAKTIGRDFESFHCGKSKDYLLRNCLKDTKFWGSYITDLFKDKDLVTADRSELNKKLKESPRHYEDAAMRALSREIEILETGNGKKYVVLIVVGKTTWNYFKQFENGLYLPRPAICVPHYSQNQLTHKIIENLAKII